MKRMCLLVWLFCAAVCFALPSGVVQTEAGEAQTGEFRDLMAMSLEDLLNINVFSATRHEQRLIESPRSVSIATGEEIRRRNYRTTPEALNELVDVLVQETNYSGGSPIIRGLIDNQILVLVDGIRLNNAIFRYGPNQYLNTIDVNQIEPGDREMDQTCWLCQNFFYGSRSGIIILSYTHSLSVSGITPRIS